jgi:integrase
MAPRPTGQVVVDARRKSTVYGLRFRADGHRHYVTLGTAEGGWTRERAELELENTMADVRRGIWKAPEPEPAPVADQDPAFHEFASDWFEASKGEWRPKTRLDYKWKLSRHLLPFFMHHRLSQITIAEVDRFRAAKVSEGAKLARAQADWRTRLDEAEDPAKRREIMQQRPARGLSPASINKAITLLAQVLEVAVEYELISRNPAKGRRRRLKADRPAPVWLDSAEQIAALLDAAGELDREARVDRQVPRRAILATLVFAGLRIGELIDLRWKDVDLAEGRITVRTSKTDASVRTIDLLPVLRSELALLRATRVGGRGASGSVLSLDAHRDSKALASQRVFPTQDGGPMNQSNVRNRLLAKAVARANERLQDADANPLPEHLTPHKLRHTYASLLVALGVDMGATMDQLGHTDAAFTLRVYRHGMRRDEVSKAKLRALVEGASLTAPSPSKAADVVG